MKLSNEQILEHAFFLVLTNIDFSFKGEEKEEYENVQKILSRFISDIENLKKTQLPQVKYPSHEIEVEGMGTIGKPLP